MVVWWRGKPLDVFLFHLPLPFGYNHFLAHVETAGWSHPLLKALRIVLALHLKSTLRTRKISFLDFVSFLRRPLINHIHARLSIF